MGTELDMKIVKQILDEWEKKRQEIEKGKHKLYIVNVGRMNHGKSSLFNALLGKECFETGDRRVTMKCSEVEIEKDVFLVDTPGLDNDEEDDKEAFEAYAKANCIMYVHNIKIGELHAKEIEHLNYIKSIMPSADYLKEHFCLIFTGKDEYDDDKFEGIKGKTLKLLTEYCRLGGIPVFAVSNTTYIDSFEAEGEERQMMLEYSGIEDLCRYMKEHYAAWRKDSRKKVDYQLKNEAEKVSEKLSSIKKNYLDHKDDLIKQEKKNIKLISEFHDVCLKGEEFKMDIEAKQAKINRMKKELKNMEDAHKKAKANF